MNETITNCCMCGKEIPAEFSEVCEEGHLCPDCAFEMKIKRGNW